MSNKQFFIEPSDFQIYRNMDKYLIPGDLILALLSISDVKQYAKMQMLVFLSWKEVFKEITFDLAFFPSGSAMISENVDHSLKTLQTRKLITVDGIEDGSLYSITSSGRSKLMEKLDIVGSDLRDLREKRLQWDDWSIGKTFAEDYLVRHVVPEALAEAKKEILGSSSLALMVYSLSLLFSVSSLTCFCNTSLSSSIDNNSVAFR
jgi:hypothetical protein